MLNIAYLPCLLGGLRIFSTDGAASSVSLIVNGNLDCLEAENVSFRIGIDQTFLARKLSVDKSFCTLSSPTFSGIIRPDRKTVTDSVSGRLSNNKIAEYLHDKDGML